jgi:hypothetical protein
MLNVNGDVKPRSERLWVGGVPVYVDHTRPDLARPPQRYLQEVLGGNDITLGRQHKVDGLSRGVNGRKHDHMVLEMAPSEQGRPVFPHRVHRIKSLA